jgi:hypothetical protein
MELIVATGTTKSNAAISLAPVVLDGIKGEQACLLLQIHAHPRDAKMLEEECVTIVRHALFESDGESWHRLDGALKELNGLFKGFIASGAVSDIHAVISFVDREQSIHLSHAGRGEAYLVRHGAASQVTEFSKGKPIPMFVHIASGELEAGDTVLLATQRLLRIVTPAMLAQMAVRHTQVIEELTAQLEGEREMAALACLHVPNIKPLHDMLKPEEESSSPRRPRRGESRLGAASILSTGAGLLKSAGKAVTPMFSRMMKQGGSSGMMGSWKKRFTSFASDLRHPERKKRAHLLILAGAVALFIVLWLLFQMTTLSQQSKSRAQLQEIMKQVEDNLKSAESKRLLGDMDAANAILARAEDQAKQVMSSDTGLFRSEALTLLDKVRTKKEEITNVIRVSPRLVVNLATKNSSISAQGLIGIADGEFLVYDRQQTYHVLLSSVEDGRVLTEGDSILRGTSFDRLKSSVFLASGNGLIEFLGGQSTVMKTEDTGGWPAGRDVEAYLRYLYILSTDGKIYKYERLSNRYGPSVQYNVNGDLSNALDMTIDQSVYVLKDGGEVVKLFRGEAQQFAVHGAPAGVLKGATRVVKPAGGHLYFMDPEKKRIIVIADNAPSGDVSYVRQYILEGEQVGTLQDLYVDPDESHLYVLDEQRLHVLDIKK